ncbi:Cobalt transport protein CbiN [Streptomyces griseoloalbus]
MSRNAKINSLLLLRRRARRDPAGVRARRPQGEPFAGSDGEAEPRSPRSTHYEPWFSPLYEPPSGEIESALFALQAAIGAGVLAYYFGLRRGRRQGEARTRERAAEDAGAADAVDTADAGDAGTDAGASAGTGDGRD